MVITQPANPRRYALTGGRVWDSTNSCLRAGLAVQVEAGTIVGVYPPEQAPSDVEMVDVGGLSLLPGLIDVHVHSEDWHGPLYLACGVTTVRDTGCALEEVLQRRRRWSTPGALAPRLVCCGPMLNGPGPALLPMGVVVRTADEARLEVDRLVEAGVDQIKLYARLDWPCFMAALERAKQHGKYTIAHLQDFGDARQAILAGVDEIEHLSGCAEALWPERHAEGQHWRRLWPDLPAERMDALVALIIERRTWMAVTRGVWYKIGTVWDPRHLDHPQLRYAPVSLRSWWAKVYPADVSAELRLEWIRALAAMQVFTASLVEGGARIIAGSDAPFVNLVPGFSLHDELQLLVDCGMRPAQALDAATRLAAEALGLSGAVGTIEPGKEADLLLIDGDPGQDIRALARIQRVLRAGVWHEPGHLLAQAETQPDTAAQRLQRRISDLY